MATWYLPLCTTMKIIVCSQVCITEKSFHKFLSKFFVVCLRRKQFLSSKLFQTWEFILQLERSSSTGRHSSQEQIGLAITGATQSLVCFLFVCDRGIFHVAKFRWHFNLGLLFSLV